MEKRKLEVRFDLYENGIVFQVLQQIGLPEEKKVGAIQIFAHPALDISDDGTFQLYLRGNNTRMDNEASWASINEHQKQIINDIEDSITEELFGDISSEKKQGDIVKVRNTYMSEWVERTFIAKLDTLYNGKRYITHNPSCNDIEFWGCIKKDHFFHKTYKTWTNGCTTYDCVWEER